jgi:hypothetical protein
MDLDEGVGNRRWRRGWSNGKDSSVPQCSVFNVLSFLHRLVHSDGVLWGVHDRFNGVGCDSGRTSGEDTMLMMIKAWMDYTCLLCRFPGA